MKILYVNEEGVGFMPNEIFVKKFLNHLASLPNNSKAINSTPNMVDLVIIVFFG